MPGDTRTACQPGSRRCTRGGRGLCVAAEGSAGGGRPRKAGDKTPRRSARSGACDERHPQALEASVDAGSLVPPRRHSATPRRTVLVRLVALVVRRVVLGLGHGVCAGVGAVDGCQRGHGKRVRTPRFEFPIHTAVWMLGSNAWKAFILTTGLCTRASAKSRARANQQYISSDQSVKFCDAANNAFQRPRIDC